MRTTENFDETSGTLTPNRTSRGRYIYLEAFLQGGAPWGFTLKGGLEHGEPLIISKDPSYAAPPGLSYPESTQALDPLFSILWLTSNHPVSCSLRSVRRENLM
ncbi:hypothetical protein M91_16144 [Bos mutus]|uniref:PDZ domain-containing protein n=1 Tax=Bos mutus TaxID=72004 RepID=L8IEK5_9CETA|nr:hypothetical protein M91_16144 [Bos mutus]